MKVFISWSGTLSKKLASVFNDWLPMALHQALTYYSPDDISKGELWDRSIAEQLSNVGFGVIFITPENRLSPWIHFEAGAIAKEIGRAKVCPIVFNMTKADLEQPLSRFQASEFNKNEMFQLLQSIYKSIEEPDLKAETLYTVFDMWWPKLNEKIIKVLKISSESTDPKKQLRDDRELLEEILTHVQRLSRNPTMFVLTEENLSFEEKKHRQELIELKSRVVTDIVKKLQLDENKISLLQVNAIMSAIENYPENHVQHALMYDSGYEYMIRETLYKAKKNMDLLDISDHSAPF